MNSDSACSDQQRYEYIRYVGQAHNSPFPWNAQAAMPFLARALKPFHLRSFRYSARTLYLATVPPVASTHPLSLSFCTHARPWIVLHILFRDFYIWQ
jgi:hypothetical protein